MEQAYKLSKIENNKPFWNIKIINHNGSYVFFFTWKEKITEFWKLHENNPIDFEISASLF